MTTPLTTRMPNGVTNAAPGQTMADAGTPDPSWAHVYHNDFDVYLASDWTRTTVGAGTSALAAVDGGQLLLTTTTGAADAVYHQLVAAGFKLVAGKEAWFKFRGVLSDVTNSVFHAGLIMTSTTPVTANDGVFISKPTGSGALQLNCRIGGVATVTAFPAACVLTAATEFEVGIHIDTNGMVEAFYNPTTGPMWQQTPVVRGPVAVSSPSITQVLLTPSFGILNSTGAARTLGVDYVTAVRNR